VFFLGKPGFRTEAVVKISDGALKTVLASFGELDLDADTLGVFGDDFGDDTGVDLLLVGSGSFRFT